MYPGVDPRQLAKVQEVGKFITGTIIVDYWENTAVLKLESDNEDARKAIPSMLESFSKALGEQLHMFFTVSGKIIERNKGKAKPSV